MGRRSINGHSRRRSNKRKASACEMVDAGSSPMKMTEENKDKLLMASSATTLDPVSMIATRMVVDKRQRERIEEETGMDFKNNRRGAKQARWYKQNMDQDSDSQWQSQMDEMESLSRVIPPTLEI